MIKKALLLLSAAFCLLNPAHAQTANVHRPCTTDDQNARLLKMFPQIKDFDAQLEKDIQANLHRMDLGKFAKTASFNQDSADAVIYDIPMVFHIIHNYGAENIPDNNIVALVRDVNRRYNLQNPDTSYVIPTYQGYISNSPHRYKGKANIRFHLATIDPNGKPTHGITRERSYLTNNAGDESKLNEWPPTQYLNIWIVQRFSGAHAAAAAYAIFPATAAADPYGDGPIGLYDYFNVIDTTSRGSYTFTLSHEIGHSLSLYHTFGTPNAGDANLYQQCGDDGVDDTPPTKGHGSYSAAALADTACNWTATQVGKYRITGKALSYTGDTSTTEGISFTTRTRIVIDTVTFYPATDTNAATFQPMPYQIVLTKNGNVVGSYSDTVRNRFDTLIKAHTFFNANPGTGYVLRFAKNPKARRDAAGGFYTRSFPGGMTITSDSSADHKYNYFYNLAVDYGYYKIYGNDSLVDYPDTVNSQNYMDYTFDDHMFTYGQVRRMRATLNSSVGGRSNWISASNLAATGALAPWPKVAPVPDYYTYSLTSAVQNGFVCADGSTALNFVNETWNDTATSVAWSFDHGASPATSSSKGTVPVTFNQPGWVKVELDATNSAGTNKVIDTNTVYAADPTPVSPLGYVQEFGDDNSRWPIFNYFGTDHKWEVLNTVGLQDRACIRFANYDTRTYAQPSNQTLTPAGLYADFYSPGFDLSSFGTGLCNLTFNTAGGYRTTNSAYMNDSLAIMYSTNCGKTWTALTNISHQQISNVGYVPFFFTPAGPGDWTARAVNLPPAARSSKTFFRFRYYVGSDNGGLTGYTFGTGNNFYLDRILVTSNPLGVSPVLNQVGMTLSPNPTSGSAVVTLKGGDNSLAQVLVTDVTGKEVYRTEVRLSSSATQVEIPASFISVKGMYLVQAVTNGNALTQKLVVY